MINIVKQSAFRHGYLFITAAWLYTLSFLFTNYFSFDSSPAKVAKTLGVYLKNYEKRFAGLLDDSAELKLIISNNPTDAKTEVRLLN